MYGCFHEWLTARAKKHNGVDKEAIRQMYFIQLVDVVASMFEYTGIDENVDIGILERYTCLCGMASIVKVNDKYWAMKAQYSSDVDINGIGKNVIVNSATYNKNVSRETIPVLRNNQTFMPDFFLWHYASCLAENEVSEIMQLLHSRLCPYPIANNNVEKVKIDECIQGMLNGKFMTPISERDWKDEDKQRDVINLTDNNKVDKIQYLNQYHDNIMKRFWNLLGQPVQNTGKLAQPLTDEIHSFDDSAYIYPIIKLEERKRFCEQCNTLYGWNCSVDFSKPWKMKMERIQNSSRLENEESEVEDSDGNFNE